MSIDPNDIIPIGNLATVIPGQYDHLVVEQNGRARKALAPEVNAAAAALGGALNGLVAQAEADIAPALANIGYLPPVEFATDLLVDSTRVTVEWGGHVYAPFKSELPFTTTGVFDPTQWRFLQGVTGADLASSAGAGMVGYRQQGLGAVDQTLAEVARLVFRPEQFGAKADGISDDTIPMQRAQDEAFAAGGIVELPRGTIRVSNTVVIKANTSGQGSNSTIIRALPSSNWTVERKPNASDDLSNSYTPIVRLGNKPGDSFVSRRDPVLSSCRVLGLCARPAQLTSNRAAMGWFGDGIHVSDECLVPRFHDVVVEFCQSGINTYNRTGHISWHECYLSNNFYGWWVDHSSGDYRMYDCNLDGNCFASVGIHGSHAESRTVGGVANQGGLFGWSFYAGHMGFSPYAVYQPDRGVGVRGLADVNWFQSGAEAVGNRVVQLPPLSNSARVILDGALHSFSASYRIASSPFLDYAFRFGVVSRPIYVNTHSDPGTSTGFLGKIETLQASVFCNAGWQLWETDRQDRVVDPALSNLEILQVIAAGTAISSSPQVIANIPIPVSVRRTARLKIQVEGVGVTAAAIPGLAFQVMTGNASDGSDAVTRETVFHPISSPRQYLNFSSTINPGGFAFVTLRAVGGAGLVLGTSGVGTTVRMSPVRPSI